MVPNDADDSTRFATSSWVSGWAAPVVEWFIPTPDPDPVAHLRTQLLVVFAALVALNGAVFSVLHTVHHLDGSGWAVVAVLVAIAITSPLFPLLMRAGASPRVLTPAFMAFFEAALLGVAWFDGGLSSGAVFWLVATPLAGSFVGGATVGWGVAAASASILGVLYGVEALGGTFSTALSPSDSAFHYVLNGVSAVGLTASLAALYEGPVVAQVRRMSERLRATNAALEVELAQRRQAQTRAERASRAKDSILANMSHEFRTPLTAILGYTDLLAAEVADEHRPFLAAVERGGQRLLRTLDGVLELSWIETGSDTPSLQPVDLTDVVAQVADAVGDCAAARGLTVSVSGDADLSVDADLLALQRSLSAVLDNAVRFTSAGGIDVATFREGEWGVVAISDTGCGMADAFVGDAVEPFRQASEGDARTAEGTGLGLTVAHRLVEQMGGRLDIESALGRGTTVTIRLAASSLDTLGTTPPVGDGAFAEVEAPRLRT